MSVAIGSTQAAFCATFIDEMERGGVRHAVVCPGSRSTPLVLAAIRSSLTIHVRLDERSAGFFAIGLAKMTGAPVLVMVTSGTAVAELAASVIEADLDRVPLIVATADRPPELVGTGAPQTIAQAGIFGAAVRLAVDPGPVHAIAPSAWRALASRLVIEARGGTSRLAGPVHLNVPLVDPLVAEPTSIPLGRTDGDPWYRLDRPALGAGNPLAPWIGRRGLVVAGEGSGSGDEILVAATRLGWPVLADPRCEARRSDPFVVTTADALLRDPRIAQAFAPEVILIAGGLPASKVVNQWIATLASDGVDVVRIGLGGLQRHPSMATATFLDIEPEELWRSVSSDTTACDEGWRAQWAGAEVAARGVIGSMLAEDDLSEPQVATTVSNHAALAGATLVVSSSMPIRDLEWYAAPEAEAPRVLANRGANGIDGVVSTAIGAASAEAGPVIALVGDLAFLHDVSALGDDLAPGLTLVVVVNDNHGGGIFSFLPQRDAMELQEFERLFATPKATDPVKVAAGFGYRSQRVATEPQLRAAITAGLEHGGLSVVVCSVLSRDANVELHDRLTSAVAVAATATLA
ncbi:MAG: 2-succinyl-5-enolpyruvyl-6-hydroxy-3-cyclohexene-1-carboxylic-acid synthase [Actinomycetes bacterium]